MTANKPDILYIGFVLGHGGDAVQMLDLATGMAALGGRVRVLVPELPTTLALAAEGWKRGIDVIRTGLIHVDPVASRQSPERLAEMFRAHPAEMLHFHTGDFCLSRTVPRVLAELQIPAAGVMVTVHSAYDTLNPDHERAVAWAQAAGARIRYIVCPSLHALAVQRKYGVADATLAHIPNGVDITRIRAGDGGGVRKELGLLRDEPLIVFTSRLDAQKRPQDALEGFALIAEEFPRAHLAFVGAGELAEELHSRALRAGLAERVHIPGHRSDIPDWLSAATVWMLPTETESCSLSLLEALAAACPIVSTIGGGNAEVLRDGENALIHAVGDIEGIAKGIRKLLMNPNLRAHLSANALQTARQFSLDKMIQSYSNLYYRSPTCLPLPSSRPPCA